jgi:hypothetical protein
MPDVGLFAEERFYRKPRFWRTVIGLILFIAALLLFRPEIRTILGIFSALSTGEPLAFLSFLVATAKVIGCFLALLLVFLLWVVFISRFVLPVHTPEERMKAIERLLLYFIGEHGPAIFIRNAEQIARAEEMKRSQPGVAFVDLCSAIALERNWVPLMGSGAPAVGARVRVRRRRVRIFKRKRPKGTPRELPVRVAGPGIVFTEWGEKVRGVADLRRQFRLTPNVSVATRDGFDVRSHVFVLFSLGEEPEILKVAYVGGNSAANLRTIQVDNLKKTIKGFTDEIDEDDKEEIHRFVNSYTPSASDTGASKPPANEHVIKPPYIFDPERIFAAIYSNAHNVVDDHVELWSDLPSRVATEVYRDMLSLETFDSLYLPGELDVFPFHQTFRPKFAQRMRNMGVLSYQFIRRKDKEPLEIGMPFDKSQLEIFPTQKLRTSKVLRDRGIRVIAAGFPELNPVHPGVRQQLVDYWSARWQREAQLVEADHMLEAMRVRAQARAESQRDMIYTLTQILKTSDLPREALVIRIFQSLEAIAAEPRTRQLLPEDTVNSLWDLRQYLLPGPGETG